MAAGTTLYTFPFSHYCVCVERALAFKGVRYTARRASYHDRQELIAATNQDYIPALLQDGQFVPWHEIPEFLERTVPTPTLYPNGQGALARLLEGWGHEVLEERIWRAVVTLVPPHLESDAERWVFEEMQSRTRGPWNLLEQRRSEFERDAQRYLAQVDALVSDRTWILGEPSLADFGIYGGVSPWLRVGHPVPAEFPHLGEWVRRVEAIGTDRGAPRRRQAVQG